MPTFIGTYFDFANQQNFLARDKELSTFNSHSLRFGIRYDMSVAWWDYLERGTVNLHYDYIRINYDDFRNVLEGGPAGRRTAFQFWGRRPAALCFFLVLVLPQRNLSRAIEY